MFDNQPHTPTHTFTYPTQKKRGDGIAGMYLEHTKTEHEINS